MGGAHERGPALCLREALGAPRHRLLAGMLRRWDDSQKYLSDNVHLVCEETANYLVIWCIDLEVEEVRADTAEWGVGRAQKALPFFFLLLFKFYFYHSCLFRTLQ